MLFLSRRFSRVRSATTSLSAAASARSSFTSGAVACRAVSDCLRRPSEDAVTKSHAFPRAALLGRSVRRHLSSRALGVTSQMQPVAEPPSGLSKRAPEGPRRLRFAPKSSTDQQVAGKSSSPEVNAAIVRHLDEFNVLDFAAINGFPKQAAIQSRLAFACLLPSTSEEAAKREVGAGLELTYTSIRFIFVL
jgi:hypothetical protein